MHKWRARYRLDYEEYFCTDEQVFELETTVLSEAAKIIEEQLNGNTLIELQRIDV